METMRDRLAMLKALRPGLTMDELARRCHVSRVTMQRWFRTGQIPDAKLDCLARQLGTTAVYLRYGKDERSAALDRQALREVIEAVLKHLRARQIDLPPHKLAEVVLLLYSHLILTGQLTDEVVGQHIDLAV